MQISEELKSWLESVPFALLCVKLDLGAGPETLVVVKSTRDLVAGLREADAVARVGWTVEPTEAGPVACMCLRCAADGVGELVGEAYFDPLKEEEMELLEPIGGQQRLKAALFDEKMDLVWAPDLVWGDIDKLYAEQAADRCEELAELALLDELEIDFERACELFRDAFPLEKLLGSIVGVSVEK